MTAKTVNYSLGFVGAMSNPVFLPEALEEPLLDIICRYVFDPFVRKHKFKLREFHHSSYRYLVLLPEGLIRFMMCRDNISEDEAEKVDNMHLS
jgi:hypothetical protein